MFQLTEDYLCEHLSYFLCDYTEKGKNTVLYEEMFCPESFTVYDKMYGNETIYFRDISFSDWCKGLISDQISKLSTIPDPLSLASKIFENLLFMLEYKLDGNELSKKIYNQEFVDIIRRVMFYTIYGACDSDVYTAKEFNELSLCIMPELIEIIRNENLEIKEIFLLSVASGLVGLDMKGAPSAASKYANPGIPMKVYRNIAPQTAAKDILRKLNKIIKSSDTPVFYWNDFLENIRHASRIVWMTDDYIESFFDLFFIQKLTEIFSDIKIDIIPKNGRFGNDMSWYDLETITLLPIFKGIKDKIKSGQISINHFGPQMGAANLNKLSKECMKSISCADFVITKGCRIHEMIQGGINKKLFSAYIVTRELSQIVTGLDSACTPILLLYAQPGEYLFWGVNFNNAKKSYMSGEECSLESFSTIREHEARKGITCIEEIVSEFNRIYSCLKHYKGSKRPVYQELALLSEKIDFYTMTKYSENYQKFCCLHNELNDFDKHTWDILMTTVRKNISTTFSNINVLDVAAGSGRDLLYGQQLGLEMFGCDICEEFIRNYNEKYIDKAPIYVYGNAYELPFEDESFLVVRQNASLVHTPLIYKGKGADLAISESYRVLKDGGILYLLVKKGKGIKVVDTNEGLGERIFQYYDEDDLTELLRRNNFEIFSMDELTEKRKTILIRWIVCVAIKRNN